MQDTAGGVALYHYPTPILPESLQCESVHQCESVQQSDSNTRRQNSSWKCPLWSTRKVYLCTRQSIHFYFVQARFYICCHQPIIVLILFLFLLINQQEQKQNLINWKEQEQNQVNKYSKCGCVEFTRTCLTHCNTVLNTGCKKGLSREIKCPQFFRQLFKFGWTCCLFKQWDNIFILFKNFLIALHLHYEILSALKKITDQ